MAKKRRRAKPPADPVAAASFEALASIDAIHAADKRQLNRPTRRLQRIARIRRALYYSILWPFGALSRLGRWVLAPTVAAAAIGFAVVIGNPNLPTWLAVILFYWVAGGLAFFALSLQMASALERAAASVGLDADELLRTWAGSDGGMRHR